ncbi:amino acid adenylation domain-containing protein [Lentzea sp. NPDC060358]|uniref:amino acid adenylation domain-containing protein n=1 Tax=Lentzea sp. NPDC060358 TaxID=3347103 RepID=UPI0036618086
MLRTVTWPADGAVDLAVPPREALAALVAVTARRTHSDVVEVTAGATTTGVDLAADPPFADLCAQVEPLLAGADPVAVDGSGLVSTPDGSRLHARTADVASQVAQALDDAGRDPSTRISVLRLASEADLAAVARFGAGAAPPAARTIPDLVRARAAAGPDAVAVSGGGLALTYRQLVDRADALAAVLVTAGVRPGEVVGVVGGRSPGLVTALLAVLRAGGAYLAPAPDWPDARVTALLDDAGVRVVLADPGLGQVPGGRTVVPFDAPEPTDPVALPADLSPDALAYVSYTSGSTGEPKGVCVPHRAVARLVDEPDWADLGPGDTVLQAAPVAFDASTFELWGTLAAGARLALLPPGDVDPAGLAAAITGEGVTVLWLTAGLFQQMTDRHLDCFAGVRHALAGGDVVSPDAVARLLDAHPGIVFTNGYGPTENTTFTTCATIRGSAGDGPLPIGRPIRGTDVRVLDPLGRPVPPGVVGHLHALGAGLALGYLGKPAATAEAFPPAPGGGRQYRTGDLARWRADGTLEFAGRADEQVKINGYRVEPGEAAAVLREHPGVAAAEVTAEPAAGGGTQLVAHVVTTGDAPSPRDLRDWARARVPGFLVPARVRVVDRFPLTGNGKLDRAALARQDHDEEPGTAAAPGTPLERYLCRLWAQALRLDEVGVDDDFFELGGHSLIAADLIVRLREDLGVELRARTFYLSPTVAELAASDELRPLRDRGELPL